MENYDWVIDELVDDVLPRWIQEAQNDEVDAFSDEESEFGWGYAAGEWHAYERVLTYIRQFGNWR